MIPFALFKRAVTDILKLIEDNRKLTNLVVSKDCTGFCSFGDEVMNSLIRVLADSLCDEHDYINWWLWDSPNDGKYVWDKEYKYDLTELEDLYHFIIGEYDKVKREKRV